VRRNDAKEKTASGDIIFAASAVSQERRGVPLCRTPQGQKLSLILPLPFPHGSGIPRLATPRPCKVSNGNHRFARVVLLSDLRRRRSISRLERACSGTGGPAIPTRNIGFARTRVLPPGNAF